MKKEKVKKIIASVATDLIVIATGLGITTLGIKAYAKEELKDKKSYEQILKDAENYGADLSVASNLSVTRIYDKFAKLKIEEGEPVIVTYQKDMEQREIDAIKKTVNYYNNVFRTIDEGYSFKLIANDEQRTIPGTLIKVTNDDIKQENVLGQNAPKFWLKRDSECFITYSKVSIDWNDIKNETDEEVLYYFIHEFGHSVGLGDVYNEGDNKTCNYEDMTTIMNVVNQESENRINMLYPNDYATLQALYSNEYLKHDNYEDSVEVVNKKIEDYSNEFYKYYCQKHIGEKPAIEQMSTKTVMVDTFIVDSNYKIKIKDGKCYFLITDFENNVLEKCVSDVHYVNGMMVVEKIELNNLKNYSPNADETKAKFMLFVYENENGTISVADNLGQLDLQAKIKQEDKQAIRKT